MIVACFHQPSLCKTRAKLCFCKNLIFLGVDSIIISRRVAALPMSRLLKVGNITITSDILWCRWILFFVTRVSLETRKLHNFIAIYSSLMTWQNYPDKFGRRVYLPTYIGKLDAPLTVVANVSRVSCCCHRWCIAIKSIKQMPNIVLAVWVHP